MQMWSIPLQKKWNLISGSCSSYGSSRRFFGGYRSLRPTNFNCLVFSHNIWRHLWRTTEKQHRNGNQKEECAQSLAHRSGRCRLDAQDPSMQNEARLPPSLRQQPQRRSSKQTPPTRRSSGKMDEEHVPKHLYLTNTVRGTPHSQNKCNQRSLRACAKGAGIPSPRATRPAPAQTRNIPCRAASDSDIPSRATPGSDTHCRITAGSDIPCHTAADSDIPRYTTPNNISDSAASGRTRQTSPYAVSSRDLRRSSAS